MLRSMYSGISGLRNSQTKLDVVGNNIANVNTYGFKKGRITFKDMVSQNMAGATGSSIVMDANNRGVGGTNPRQVGLGAQIASIDTITTQGNLQTTNRTLDLSISGDGYFTVTDGGNTPYYTRAGNFYLDADGNLVSSEGYSLIGRMAIGERDQTTGVSDGDPNTNAFDPTNDNPNDEPITDGNRKLFIPSEVSKTQEVAADGTVTYNDVDPAIKLKSFSIGQDGSINAIYEGDKQPRKIGQIQVTKFTNTEGLEKVGGNLYTVSANSGDPQEVWPTSGGSGSIVSGTLEMSNVDLSEEFTEMIVGQRSFQANSRIITTSDEILQELVNLKR
ncbi:MAG TPA: flagellar hook-basal body complex protein [Firmicutes bacterium]|nr:flagellar hook-basal body complex protein [Bacillota bacterium]